MKGTSKLIHLGCCRWDAEHAQCCLVCFVRPFVLLARRGLVLLACTGVWAAACSIWPGGALPLLGWLLASGLVCSACCWLGPPAAGPPRGSCLPAGLGGRAPHELLPPLGSTACCRAPSASAPGRGAHGRRRAPCELPLAGLRPSLAPPRAALLCATPCARPRAAGGRALRAPAPPAQEQAKGEPDSTHKTNWTNQIQPRVEEIASKSKVRTALGGLLFHEFEIQELKNPS